MITCNEACPVCRVGQIVVIKTAWWIMLLVFFFQPGMMSPEGNHDSFFCSFPDHSTSQLRMIIVYNIFMHNQPLYSEEGLFFFQGHPSFRWPHVPTLMNSIYLCFGNSGFFILDLLTTKTEEASLSYCLTYCWVGEKID